MKRYFPEEDTYKQISTLKDVQRNLSLGQCKLRPWWAITIHLLEELNFLKIATMANTSKNTEKLDLSYIVKI